MPIEITYKKENSDKLAKTFVLFADEGFRALALKKTLLANKVSFVNEIIKKNESKNKKFLAFNLNSNQKVILVSIKKKPTSLDNEKIGAEFYNFVKTNSLFNLTMVEKNISSDMMARFIYQITLSLLVNTETAHSSYSSAIYYADLLADYLEDDNNISELVSENWLSLNAKMKVGNYENVIDQIFNTQRLARQLPKNEWRDFDLNLKLALSYAELRQAELGIDIINQIDTTKMRNRQCALTVNRPKKPARY